VGTSALSPPPAIHCPQHYGGLGSLPVWEVEVDGGRKDLDMNL
jgi:hypothetical protein